MDTQKPLPLLGGLSPSRFMQRHWQKKPLLVRQAVADFSSCISRAELMALAQRDDVESRLIVQGDKGWKMRAGPFSRRQFPALGQSHWTFLVQGVDLHHEGVHRFLHQFRFVPDARMDDLMISYATDGGGVGPHFDSYDVFLFQAQGRRRWRIGRQKDLALQEGLPLRILENFQPEQEYLLEPGDMLYLPPRYAHEGTAEGECMTWSIGFRSPKRSEMARELMLGLAEEAFENPSQALYRDPAQSATLEPGRIPPALQDFALDCLQQVMRDPEMPLVLMGEYLTTPKPNVWFEPADTPLAAGLGVRLDRRSRMLYDAKHLFINGESFRAGGRDARLLRQLADERQLVAESMGQLSKQAREVVVQWVSQGWLRPL
jgi:50S ribosomal protein L16 3-hydroxylase